MSEANKKEGTWSVVIAVSLLVIFGIIYFAIPKYLAEDKKLNLELAVTKKKISLTEQKIQDLHDLKDQFSQNSGQVNSLNTALPLEKQFPNTVETLQAIAGESGLQISDIRPANSKEEKSATTVNLSGFYDGLKMFLGKLENNLRPLAISEITISQPTSAISTGLLNISLTLNAFQVEADSSAKAKSENKSEEKE